MSTAEVFEPRQPTRLLSPTCPNCSRLMRLAQIVPDDRSDRTEIRTYACECGHEVWQIIAL